MKSEIVTRGVLRWHVRVYGMDSTLGAATLQAKAHAVRLFSLLWHDIDRAEFCARFCSFLDYVMFGSLPYAKLRGEVVFFWAVSHPWV